ncbi:MAG: SIMPL domain-containing protein [Candidatus Eremiobacteraeota bacterium]|nr:SIMPL domain-containing protein [Candidatus Eremiobacteraeota bacterium]
MVQKRLIVLALTLLPLAASAQVPMRTGPMQVLPGMASAQGITVLGRGTVSYPVKTLFFQAYAHGPADESGVVAAMRAAGIDDAVVGPAEARVSTGSPTMLRGTIRDVTRTKLDHLADAAASYAHAHPGAAIDNVLFLAAPAECAAHEQAARTAAIADARRRAESIAGLTGLQIDGVLAVNESLLPCPNDVPPLAYSNGQLDLARLTANLTITDNVTFAVSPAGGAKRRPL